jgi:hypothetical protein
LRTDAFGWFLLTVHGDGCVRTDERAIHATCAVVLDENNISVSLEIDLIRQTQTILGTCRNTKLTALADLFGDSHLATYHRDLPLSSTS